MDQIKKNRLWMLAIDGALLLLGILIRPLAVAMIRWLPDCIFSWSGITCPSCGATRCVRELFSGHWKAAFLLHPFFFCLCFYLAVALAVLNVGYLVPQRHCQKIGNAMVGGRAIVILSILYALFGLIRTVLTLPMWA